MNAALLTGQFSCHFEIMESSVAVKYIHIQQSSRAELLQILEILVFFHGKTKIIFHVYRITTMELKTASWS